jgi:hypothetical protein
LLFKGLGPPFDSDPSLKSRFQELSERLRRQIAIPELIRISGGTDGLAEPYEHQESAITGVLLDPFPTAFLPNLIATFYGNFLLIGLMAGWDLWRRGALNRAFAIGASLLIASEVWAVALEYSPAWKGIAIAITRAWGYAG